MRTRYGPGVSIPTTDGAEIEAQPKSGIYLYRSQAVGGPAYARRQEGPGKAATA
jgi:hypothetical protein